MIRRSPNQTPLRAVSRVIFMAIFALGLACSGQMSGPGLWDDHSAPGPGSRRRGGDTGVVPHRIFFPPNPPPLGVEVQTPRNVRRRGGAPEEMAEHVGEIFYAPLGTRLAEGAMTAELTTRLEGYRKQRFQLLEELRDHLYGTREADLEARLRFNAGFARQQTPRIAALEAVADALRRELLRGGSFGGTSWDWNDRREWKLGRGELKRPREENGVFEYQVMRAAVFYQEGLSPAQRRLLREVVMELEDRVFRPESPPLSEYGFIFFSPDTVRLRLPAGLPQDAAVRLAAYEREKSALRAELRDAVYENDATAFASQRKRALEELAAKQRRRLEDLEELAEDIRRELASTPGLERPPAPEPLPKALESMLRKYEDDKAALQRALVTEVRAAQHAVGPPGGGDPGASFEWRERMMEATESATRRFQKENPVSFLELQQQLEAMVAVMEEQGLGGEELASGAQAEATVRTFLSRQRKAESAFEYHTAVLEPGLSPEQRRLLFGAALARMGLPLPGGEFQPTALPGTMLPLDELGR